MELMKDCFSDVKEKFKKAFIAWFTGDDTGQLCMSDNAVITFSSKFTNESRSCVELALVISLPVTTTRERAEGVWAQH